MHHDRLLILDLDETLIHASGVPLDRPADFIAGRWHVYKRPHLEAFLASCLEWFTVAVWTSASPAYATRIVATVFPNPEQLAFVWAADRCSQRYDHEMFEHYWRKNLHKVRRKGWPLERVIVVDDTPRKWEQSYGNLVRVRAFEGDPADDELPLLLRYLEELRHVPNVRRIEKRYWRQHVLRLGSGDA
jgi:RNA polymerase II subunit A small phosphatase-like protein